MRPSLLAALVVWAALNPLAGAVAPQQSRTAPDDGVGALLRRVEAALTAGSPSGYLDLLSATANVARARQFAAAAFSPGVTRAVVRERDRGPLKGTPEGDGYSLLVEVLVETGARARLSTWRLDVRRQTGAPNGQADSWGIAGQESLGTLHGLYRLSLNPRKQFATDNVTIAAEDFQLTMKAGSAFEADAGGGPTAIVLIGSGEMTFRPAPAAERDQVKIFSGSETLQTSFDAAFLRLDPGDLDSHIVRGALVERPVDQRDLKRADEVFEEDVPRSFGLDLSDLSPDAWSLVPSSGDFLAEVHTRRFETLTYARSHGEPEDITLFDRKGRRNIALYASSQKLAAQGRFYDEDDLADYEVLDYDLDVAFVPSRLWINGRARLEIVTRAPSLSVLTLRLADPLTVRAVVSNELGRLLAVRVRNQNSVVVNLPSTITKGTKLTLTVIYNGRLEPQSIDREIVALGQIQRGGQEEGISLAPEERYLYSNRSYWYPGSPAGNYATAVLRLRVPPQYSCAASGELITDAAEPGDGAPDTGGKGQEAAPRVFLFRTIRPVRYLSCLITRLVKISNEEVQAAPAVHGGDDTRAGGGGYRELNLRVEANPRQEGRGRGLSQRAAAILRFYSSLLGDFPYPSLTCVLVENDLPGGHSPAYLAILNQQLPNSQLVWRDDPASFPGYADFFLAHEIAHQWWGQAVGWKNYHEQWLSEGLAQYFALLNADRVRGPEMFNDAIRRARDWAIKDSNQGAVYLGYRVGHIKKDGRIFRAVIYNKSAAVLHMLRRLIGDEAFFRGIRRFYRTWRYHKAGTEDLRKAFEQESGISLERFFERWIYNASLPDVKFSSRTEAGPAGPEVVLRFEQSGEIFDFPVTVTLFYADGRTTDILMKVTDRVVETRMPLKGRLSRVVVNRDETTVAEFPS